MDSILQVFRNLGAVRLAIVGGTTVGILGFFIWMLARLTTPEYALLYGNLDLTESAAIVSQLESEQIPYQLRRNGDAIYVPQEMVARTRLRLADQGLPSGGSVGYELFDKGDSLGSTNFMQNVKLVRALEGELARTIGSIDGVRSARVHLVLPKRQLFSREKQEPSASVVLRMRGNNRLSHGQVLAVQHLVASSVPGLVPNRISVIDDRGTLLAAGFEDEDPVSRLSSKAEEQRIRYQNHLARTIEELLEKTVGPGKVRAEVTAEMDFDQINTEEEIYDPDGQVVRSTQTVEHKSNSKEGGPPPVSVATNLPDAQLAAGEPGGASNTENRTEETVNYEISKKVVNHVRESGTVKRLSVAVLVDGTYVPADNGDSTYQPRSDKQLKLLASLVRGAIGFDAARGDTVEVINMPFAGAESEAEPPAELFFGLDVNDLLRLAQYLVLIIFALLVILLVVRPLLTRVLETLPLPATGPAGELLGHDEAAPALAAPDQSGLALADSRAPGDGELEEMIDLDRVEGQVRTSAVKKVAEIVEKHPEEALSIVRNWLHNEES